MAFTASMQRGISVGGVTRSKATSYSGGAATRIDEAIADSSTDELIVFTADVSQCVACYIKSDQAITIETNNGGAPVDTLVLVADLAYMWNTDWYDTFVFGTDITALYITNASGSTANLEIEWVYDPTP